MKNHQHIVKVLEGFHANLLKQSSLETKSKNSNLKPDELNKKLIVNLVGLLDDYKKERDELEKKRNNPLLENRHCCCWFAWFDPQFFKFFEDFSFTEILEATDSFNVSRMIGEGSFGDTYKGLLRCTEIVVKIPSMHNLHGAREFQHTYKLEMLNKMRHPYILPLVGVCLEASALVYEYASNGNLSDRLACKDNTPSLSWRTRTRIAYELCSALIYMHYCRPESVIHGDLKPTNILLDANLSCKLIGFGMCSTIFNVETLSMFYRTDPKGLFVYMSPELISTGEVTSKSDVYSFGIILLYLLTGKSTLEIKKEVRNAFDKDNLYAILDASAGDWPYAHAKQLALLALRCSKADPMTRPDLNVDVRWVLEKLMGISSASLGRDENDRVPSYFMCPILQEVMKDPHIAADGFTYEAEALKRWLNSGRKTSPMTNLKLENCDIIPNRTLRSAIRDWNQRQPSTS